MRHGDVILTQQWRHRLKCSQRATDVRLFGFYHSHLLVQVFEIELSRSGVREIVVFNGHVNPYRPGILFVGHRQTVKTQIRCHRMWRLIRVFTVCLQNIQLKFKSK